MNQSTKVEKSLVDGIKKDKSQNESVKKSDLIFGEWY